MSAMFKHAFTQINNAAEIINSFTETASGVEGVPKVNVAKGACNLICTGMEIRSLKSNMYGLTSRVNHYLKLLNYSQLHKLFHHNS
jgi:hypothetical protein